MVKELLQLQSTGSQGRSHFFKNRYKLDRKLGQRVLLQFKQSFFKKTAIKLRCFSFRKIFRNVWKSCFTSSKSSFQKIQPPQQNPPLFFRFPPTAFPYGLDVIPSTVRPEVLGQGRSERWATDGSWLAILIHEFHVNHQPRVVGTPRGPSLGCWEPKGSLPRGTPRSPQGRWVGRNVHPGTPKGNGTENPMVGGLEEWFRNPTIPTTQGIVGWCWM